VILGIDASNLRRGGGVTHLTELLRAADPKASGFDRVLVWAGSATLAKIEERDWLRKMHDPMLDGPLLERLCWQRFRLPELARAAECDVLFVPGGSGAGGFRPVVTMSQNMLPFQWREARRYGISGMAVRLLLVHFAQKRNFRRADGVIFLTPYAADVILKSVGKHRGTTTVIPHGVEERFLRSPRAQRPITDYSAADPFRILYVSIVDVYKHQWHVAEAVAQLRAEGYPVQLEMVGPAYGPAMRRLRPVLQRRDPDGKFLRYTGNIDYARLHETYYAADLNVFASSCENMPIILLEAMASGLPIACSERGPMPGMLGEGGSYFDPESPGSIAASLRILLDSPELRAKRARAALERTQQYSWTRCARETFDFFSRVRDAYEKSRHNNAFNP
jgi:glycosyltransferase involved in cell wall biosynthesis